MLAQRSKSDLEVAKVATLLKYRLVRKDTRYYLAKRYDTQYVISQCKQQDRDAKTKYYRNPAGDIVSRITDERETPDFPVQAEPNRKPYKNCPFVDDDKCWNCFWYDKGDSGCTA